MKKIKGWILIIFCSILLLIFALVLTLLIPDLLNSNSELPMSNKDILISTAGFLIVISLLIFGLRNGLKKIMKDKVREIIDYPGDLKINFKGKIEYKDYRNLILGLTFKKPFYLVFIGIMFLFTMPLFAKEENILNQSDFYYLILIFMVVFLFSPFITLVRIKRIYKTHDIFKEQLNYNITNDSIHVKGDTFDSTLAWTHFYQLRETKNFFMFYHGTVVATILDKKMFSQTDLTEFQQFIKSLNVKKV